MIVRDPADTRALRLTADGDVADAIARAVYGREAGHTEALLEANPGLADLGPVLPAGLFVALPARPPEPAETPLRLWS